MATLLFTENKTGKISANIITANKQPVESATVQFVKAGNKAIVKADLTDKNGNFEFGKIPERKQKGRAAAGQLQRKSNNVWVQEVNF